MHRLSWDDLGAHFYKVGIDRGVLYPMSGEVYLSGVAWNGLTGLDYNSAGSDSTKLYSDDFVEDVLLTSEEFGGIIKCFTYPEAFDGCLGYSDIATGLSVGQQDPVSFGLTYRTNKGNDAKGNSYGYYLHFVYGALVTSVSDSENTIGSSLDPTEFGFTFTTVPVELEGYNPVAHVVVDASKISSAKLAVIESIIWGTASTSPRMPRPQELFYIITGVTYTASTITTRYVTSNGIYDTTGYDAFSVNVSTGVFPSGTLYINKNDVYDVSNYQYANVAISGSGAINQSGIYVPTEEDLISGIIDISSYSYIDLRALMFIPGSSNVLVVTSNGTYNVLSMAYATVNILSAETITTETGEILLTESGEELLIDS